MEPQPLEGNKILHDTYKHLTTLSTGAILILVALMEKFFQQPKWRLLIGVTLVSLIVSTVTSVATMFFISSQVTTGEETGGLLARLIVLLIVLLSCGGFLLGIIALVVFALRNFLWA